MIHQSLGDLDQVERELIPGLEEFLKDYPKMMIVPTINSFLVLKGEFEFSVSQSHLQYIKDAYELKIDVPSSFPSVVPTVTETGRKIPRDGKHHVNPNNTLCLGSPLRLLWKLRQLPTLVGFAAKCLLPYLYSISHKMQHGSYPFGELEHGNPGIIRDYLELFGLKTRDQVIRVLILLGKKKRLANKLPCPCGCGMRLGACSYHFKMLKLRELGGRSFFRQHLADLGYKQ